MVPRKGLEPHGHLALKAHILWGLRAKMTQRERKCDAFCDANCDADRVPTAYLRRVFKGRFYGEVSDGLSVVGASMNRLSINDRPEIREIFSSFLQRKLARPTRLAPALLSASASSSSGGGLESKRLARFHHRIPRKTMSWAKGGLLNIKRTLPPPRFKPQSSLRPLFSMEIIE